MICQHDFREYEAPCDHGWISECVSCGVQIWVSFEDGGRGRLVARVSCRMPEGSPALPLLEMGRLAGEAMDRASASVVAAQRQAELQLGPLRSRKGARRWR